MKTFDNVCGIYMDHPRALLTAGGVLSVISLGIIFLLFYYFKIPNLRRHPTSKISRCFGRLLSSYCKHLLSPSLQRSQSTNAGLS
jgi:hypothetical protein